MSLTKWKPFLESFEDMDKFFEKFPEKFSSFMPVIDVYQVKDKVVVETPLAGIEPDKVDISINNNILTIRGNSEKKTEVEEKNYYQKEVMHGGFYRSVALPVNVIGKKAVATFINGMLKIVIPKASESKEKSVKVKIKLEKKK